MTAIETGAVSSPRRQVRQCTFTIQVVDRDQPGQTWDLMTSQTKNTVARGGEQMDSTRDDK